jgi:hypothetical protein
VDAPGIASRCPEGPRSGTIHYEVIFEALAEGYVVPEGVEDEVAMERVDALAADAAGSLAEAFEEFLFPDAVDAAAPPA